MSERTHLMIQQWLQQALPENELSARLQNLSESFPYFSAAHLLRYYTGDVNDQNVGAWKKEAALHVYNPLQIEKTADDEMFQNPFAEAEVITPATKEMEPIVPQEAILEPEPTPEEVEEAPVVHSILEENDSAETEAELDVAHFENR